MPDQLVMSIATVLVTKGAEALATGARSAIAALRRTVRKKLAEDADDAKVLEGAVAHPDEHWRQVELAATLARLMARDAAFAQVVRTRWRAVGTDVSVTRGAVLNQFSGSAEKVVQARDISGDVSL